MRSATFRTLITAGASLLVSGMISCLDYDLNHWGEEEPPAPEIEVGDDDVADGYDVEPGPQGEAPEWPEEEEPVEDDPPEELPEEEDLPDCDETVMADWQWWGSMPFGHEDDLVDGYGRPFFDVDYTMVDYSTVSIPDQGHITSGYDKAYRAEFDLNQIPPALFLSMQSDDGMAFFLNGELVGEWGGTWQEEGCVNDNAGCTQSVVVPPVDVTDYLVVGRNVAAARVSNPVDNSYFEVYTECVD